MSVSSLTATQIRDAQEAFRLFDRDSDGKIHATVLGQTLRSLALSPTNAVCLELDNFRESTIEINLFYRQLQKSSLNSA